MRAIVIRTFYNLWALLLLNVTGAFAGDIDLELDKDKDRLFPVVDANNKIVNPKDDGSFYRIMPTYQEKVTEEQVKNFFENARQIGSVVDDLLRFESDSRLPAVIQKRVNGVLYEIGLEKLVFTPQGNTLSIFAMITTPDKKQICFAGEEVGFTGQGGIKEGTLKLVLGNENLLRFDKLQKIDLEILGGSLKFSCNGYESFSLAGRVIFDRSLIVPENPITGDIIAGNVQSDFTLTDVQSWNDMLIDINMQPFQMPSMQGYGFQVDRAVLDISDGKNAISMSFPKEYGVVGAQWQGVYLGGINVRFPTYFKVRSGKYYGVRVGIGGRDIIIDRFGVSGEIFGESVFSSQEGDLNGWDYSISKASILLIKNQVKAGSLSGQMRVSVAGEAELMGYTAVIDPTRDYYNFTVNNTKELSFEFLKASTVTLAPASTVGLMLEKKEFVAKANLHGSLDIGSAEYGINLEKFVFQNLKISTQQPYLAIGTFGGGSGKEYSLGNFPITLNAPIIRGEGNEIGVEFGLNLTLDNIGISASGGFLVTGEFVNANNRHFWKNKHIGVKKIGISADFTQFAFRGEADFFKDDPVYGKGFSGAIRLAACINNCVYGEAVGVFGREKGKPSYWFVDGEVDLFQAQTSNFQLTLLAGTLYKKMKPASGMISGIKSLSGVTYVPDYSISRGARFGAGLRINGGGKLISGAGGLEVIARETGGIEKFGLMGIVAIAGSEEQHSTAFIRESYGRMCSGDFSPGQFTNKDASNANSSDVKSQANSLFPTRENGFNGSIILSFNFVERSFMGRVGCEVVNPKLEFAFLGAFYFSPSKWYIHLGEPSQRLKLKLPTLPPVFDAYMMFGHGLIELPQPQPNIFESKPSLRSERATGIQASAGISGKGFAFGAGATLNIASGENKFASFNASVRAGLDLMVLNYGSGVRCEGYPGSIGINGWLGQGQLYALGGISVALFKVPALSLQLGALLKGTAPNPTSGQGQVVISFKVFVKKIEAKVGFEIGDVCKLVKTDIANQDIEIYKTTYPLKNAVGVPYTLKPYVQFTEEVDREVSIEELGLNARLSVVSFSLIKQSNGENVRGNWDVEKPDRTKLFFEPKRSLEGNTDYKAIAKILLEKEVGGRWSPLTLGEESAEREYSFNFKTIMTPEQLAATKKQMVVPPPPPPPLPPPPPPPVEPQDNSVNDNGQSEREAYEQQLRQQQEYNRQLAERLAYEQRIREQQAAYEALLAEQRRLALEAEIQRIQNDEALRRQAEAAHQAQLQLVAEQTAAENARIAEAAAEAQRQLDEINRQAEERARQIQEEAQREAEAIRQQNEQRKAALDEMIRQAQADEEHKRAAQEAADAAKKAADEAARRAEEYVQHITNQAVADVNQVTEQSKIEVENVKTESQNRVTQIGWETEAEIRRLAVEKQAVLNRLVAERKAAVRNISWIKFTQRADMKRAYKQKALEVQNRYNAMISALPSQSLQRQQQVSAEAQQRMDAIVANAKARSEQIMAEAANKSQEAMQRARETANAIMAAAEQQCRDILGGGPAIADTSAFADLLKAQNDFYDESGDD